jgi:hypothetical protein
LPFAKIGTVPAPKKRHRRSRHFAAEEDDFGGAFNRQARVLPTKAPRPGGGRSSRSFGSVELVTIIAHILRAEARRVPGDHRGGLAKGKLAVGVALHGGQIGHNRSLWAAFRTDILGTDSTGTRSLNRQRYKRPAQPLCPHPNTARSIWPSGPAYAPSENRDRILSESHQGCCWRCGRCVCS